MADKTRDDPGRGKESSDAPREDYFSPQESGTSGAAYQNKRVGPLDSVRARLGAEPGAGSPTSPRSPRTPIVGRTTSSAFNSPGQGFRIDDECFVFEFSSRYLRAGLGGESQPRCKLDFAPEMQKRPGDYSQWQGGMKHSSTHSGDEFASWGQDHVLWQMDLRGVDLGLVEDKIERALRLAIVDYLLVLDDSKKRKFVLVIPSVMPHPLLTTLLSALFNVFAPPPSVVLLSSPMVCTLAAGLRSALVVDIGWTGTTATAIYEYREVQHKISRRGMKLLSWEVRNLLKAKLENEAANTELSTHVSFADVEEVLNRMIWCNIRSGSETPTQASSRDSTVQIPLASSLPPRTLSIPFQQLSQPPETALICSDEDHETKYDDDELPIPLLLFITLLSLPIDVRQVCQSRIVITGGGSKIPGLKARLLDELSRLVSTRGWDPVANYGSAKIPKSRRVVDILNGETHVNESTDPGANANGHMNKDIDPSTTSATHQQPPLPDPVTTTIRSRSAAAGSPADPTAPAASDGENKQEINSSHTTDSGLPKIRGAQSLGAWAGASLVAGLRIRGLVEVDREKFTQHGLASGMGPAATAGPKRQSMAAAPSQRQSLVGGPAGSALGKAGDRESGTWTLGVWA